LWAVALTKRLNCRFVTGMRSIQKPSTVTRWTGAILRIVIVGAYAERAAGNPDHVAGPSTFRLSIVPLNVRPQQRHDRKLQTYVPAKLPCQTGGSRNKI